MHFRQFEERHRWVNMVFCVIGHIPRQPTDRAGGECGAGVFEHVVAMRAQCVFGQKVKPQERLPQDHRQNPDPDQQRRLQDEADQNQMRINRQHDRGFPLNRPPAFLWDIGIITRPAGRRPQRRDGSLP